MGVSLGSNTSASSGQVEYAFATLNADTLSLNGSTIPMSTSIGSIPHTNGVFTLKAGHTYSLDGRVGKTTTDGTNGFAFRWQNITDGILFGSFAQAIAPTANVDSTAISSAYAVITPATEILVRLYNTEGANRTARAGHTSATIIELGSSPIVVQTKAYVQARKSVTQSLPSGVATTLVNWFELIDNTNSFDGTTGVFTAPTSGTYLVSGSWMNTGYLAVNSGDDFRATLVKNGVDYAASLVDSNDEAATMNFNPTVSAVMGLTTGDLVTLTAYQASPDPRTLSTAQGGIYNNFSVVQLS